VTVVSPEECRRDIDDVAVHQASRLEVVRNTSPALDQQLEDAAPPQVVEHDVQISGHLERG
jgi:hypothetical protein